MVLKEYCKLDPALNLIGDLTIDFACLNIPKARSSSHPFTTVSSIGRNRQTKRTSSKVYLWEWVI